MNTTLVFVLYVLAVMRVTRLVNFDMIMDWLHTFIGRVFGPGSWQATFFECPWCVGMWVALLTSWAPVLYPHNVVVQIVLLALAASMVTGLMARFSSESAVLEPK